MLKTTVLEFPEMKRACASPVIKSWVYRGSFRVWRLIRRVARLGFKGS